VVASFPDATLAHLARQRLSSEGLEARLADEHTASIDPLLAGAIGGVKLLVRDEDVARVRAVLDAEGDATGDAEDDEPSCGACGSAYLTRRSPAFFALRRALGLVERGTSEPWWCERCGSEVDPTEAAAASPYRAKPSRVGEPVFRFERGRAALGATFGLFGGALGAAMGHPELLGLLPLGGALLGNGVVRAVCSRPGCGAPLDPQATRCPGCRGVVAGEVRSLREHWVRRAAWKRGAELPDGR
jgi:hypothetical protein